MKSINIRSLKNETTAVLERIALGESLEIRRRNKPLAILKPLETGRSRVSRPDFRQRLRDIYGDRQLPTTATDLLANERGTR
jgi:antitoxin (DNA-binding transcriptional repressor) of toxin-antitoxin stability system